MVLHCAPQSPRSSPGKGGRIEHAQAINSRCCSDQSSYACETPACYKQHSVAMFSTCSHPYTRIPTYLTVTNYLSTCPPTYLPTLLPAHLATSRPTCHAAQTNPTRPRIQPTKQPIRHCSTGPSYRPTERPAYSHVCL